MKKWLSLILAFIIIGTVLFGYNEFNGNFISKKMAKNTLEHYLEEQYGDIRYQVDKGFYNFKFDTYDFDVTFYEDALNWTYSFEVGPKIVPTTIQTITMHYDSKDDSLSTAWSEQGSRYIKELLAGLPVGAISYYIEIPRNFTEAKWSPTIDVLIAPSISIDCSLYKGESKEEFLQTAKEIQTRLNTDGINYDHVFLSMDAKFDNRDGKKEGYAPIYYERKYSVQFTPNKEVTLEDIY